MARASRDFETFNGKADPGGGYATAPFDDGSEFRAAAQMFQGLGQRLGQMADKAAATAAYAGALKEADNNIGLPETTFKLKPGKTDEAGTGRREPQAPVKGGDYFKRLAQIESGGNPNARNKDSGAAGLYQFMPSTARAYDLDNPYDPVKADVAVRRLTADNRAALMKRLGREPTPGELYLAHQQGAGGAMKLLANPNARAVDIVGAKAVTLNGGRADMSAAEFANLWVGKFEGGGGGGGSTMPAFVPSTPEYSMQVHVPAPLPLALRRDGTIAGDAHDKAVVEVAAWKMQAGLDAEMAAAYENNRDDPAAFQSAVKGVADTYVKQAEAIGPEVSMAIKERAGNQLLTYSRDVFSRNQQKVDDERKTTALAAVDEASKGIARQAYLIGANEDGDERLAALSSRAHASVDAALASGAITPAQAAAKREDIATGLVTARVQGVFDALPSPAARQAFVDGLDEQYADPKSPLAALSPDTFKRMRDDLAVDARQQTEKVQAATALEKHTLKRALADDLASMETTGKGGKLGEAEIDAGDVARILGPEDAANWLEQRGQARALWEATSTMPLKSEAEIDATLDRLEPKAGEEGFARKQDTFERAAKEADRIVKLRREDPATAAEHSFPELAKIENPAERATRRMDAQAALGIGERVRQPLTTAEARGLADRISMVEDNPDAVQPELETMMGEVQKTYGALADDVMVQVFEQRGMAKATARTGLALMQQMQLGRPPENSMLKAYGAARAVDQATQAMAGETPPPRAPQRTMQPANGRGGQRQAAPAASKARAPNAAQLNLLRKNPDLAPVFDAKFGAGAAKNFTQDREQPVRRKLGDGSIELTYPDGWVETLKPDGSVDGRQGP